LYSTYTLLFIDVLFHVTIVEELNLNSWIIRNCCLLLSQLWMTLFSCESDSAEQVFDIFCKLVLLKIPLIFRLQQLLMRTMAIQLDIQLVIALMGALLIRTQIMNYPWHLLLLKIWYQRKSAKKSIQMEFLTIRNWVSF